MILTPEQLTKAVFQLSANVESLNKTVAEHEKVHVSRRGVEGPRGERGERGLRGIPGSVGDVGPRGPVYEPSAIEVLENKFFDAKAVAKACLATGDVAGANHALDVAEAAQKELAAQKV